MTRIHRFSDGLTIYVYADDHAPPHFNVRGPDTDCNISISTLQCVVGTYDRRDFAKAVAWAAENVTVLEDWWERLHER